MTDDGYAVRLAALLARESDLDPEFAEFTRLVSSMIVQGFHHEEAIAAYAEVFGRTDHIATLLRIGAAALEADE